MAGNINFLEPADFAAPRKEYIDNYFKEIFYCEPKIYSAKLKEVFTDVKNRLRRVDVGIKNDHAEEKVILTIGATGSGKTTLINALLNYIIRIEYTDDFRMKLIDENLRETQARSMTRWITAYTIHHQPWFNTNYTLTIIDTPGFGDTEGIERDNEVMAQIRHFFSSANKYKSDHIDIIGFVASSAAARLTLTQNYILETVLSIFGKDIEENIYMLLKFADAQQPQILAALQRAGVPYQQYFKFNNAVLFHSKKDSDEDEELFYRITWKQAYKNFDFFMKEVKQVESKTLDLSAEVLQKRHKLEMVAHNTQSNIQVYLSEYSQLKKKEQILKKLQEDIEQNRNFTYTETVKISGKVPSKRTATNCKICEMSCCINCWVLHDIFTYTCSAMTYSGFCKICERKCSWKNQTIEKMIYKVYFVEIERTDQDLKRKYKAATERKANAEEMIRMCQKKISQTEEDSKNLIYLGLECSNRLRNIALRPVRLTLVQYIDILIAEEERMLTENSLERMIRLKEIKTNEKLMSRMSASWDTEEDSRKLWRDLTEIK